MKTFFTFLMVLLLTSVLAEAQSRLTVCNESKSDTLKITMLYQNHPWAPLGESWKVYGWMDVSPGRCQPLVQHPSQLKTFLSVKKKTQFGRSYIMHFPFGDDDKSLQTSERFFCVRDDPFDRVLQKLDAHEFCPAGWYEQLFNLYLMVPANTNYTLRLGK